MHASLTYLQRRWCNPFVSFTELEIWSIQQCSYYVHPSLNNSITTEQISNFGIGKFY
jgi:hypothetical protein